MRMNIVLLMCCCIVVTAVASCGGGLQTISNTPDCATTVEGTLYSRQKWNGGGPILVKQQMGTVDLWKGTIVETRDDGVVFDRERMGVLVDPEPKFFSYDDITALIDESGTLVYGTLPESLTPRWGMELVLKSQSDSRMAPVTLRMEPGKQFGYCIPAGSYAVTEVWFVSGRTHRVPASDFPPMELQMRSNAANYIGDIYLDYPVIENAAICDLSYLTDDNQQATHTLQYSYRDDFKFKGSGYLKISGIIISSQARHGGG